MKINSTIPTSHYKGSHKPANSPLLEQLSEPSDTHDEPRGSLEETGQLAVVLPSKLEANIPRLLLRGRASTERGFIAQ